jgi:hypothetical protein
VSLLTPTSPPATPSATPPASPPTGHLATPRELQRRFRALTQLGWPRRFPIVQFPNLPLIVAFVAGMAAQHLTGGGHQYAAAISYLAMFVWAYAELADGVNWFRHLLGLAYVISTVFHLAVALGHATGRV